MPEVDGGVVVTREVRKPWSNERRAWMLALVLALFSALLMHIGHDIDEATWAQALGDLLVGLALAMVVAGGRGGYGARPTIPLAIAVGILAPLIGYASDPNGVLGKLFGALEFFVIGMALAAFVITVNRRRASSAAAEETNERRAIES